MREMWRLYTRRLRSHCVALLFVTASRRREISGRPFKGKWWACRLNDARQAGPVARRDREYVREDVGSYEAFMHAFVVDGRYKGIVLHHMDDFDVAADLGHPRVPLPIKIGIYWYHSVSTVTSLLVLIYSTIMR